MKRPKYVKMLLEGKSACAMRLVGYRTYYRDCGDWDIKTSLSKGTVLADPDYSHVMHLKGATFVEITREEWIKDNGLDNMESFWECLSQFRGPQFADQQVLELKKHLKG